MDVVVQVLLPETTAAAKDLAATVPIPAAGMLDLDQGSGIGPA
jgi:hypothetical protein